MGFLSLKWKLGAAVVGVAFCLVAIYVMMAKATFESDKISYVFDTQQSQVESSARDLHQRLTQALFLARSIMSTYDFKAKQLTPVGQTLFSGQDVVDAVQLKDLETSDVLMTVERAVGSFDSAPTLDDTTLDETPRISLLTDHFLVEKKEKDDQGQAVVLKVLIQAKDPFPSRGLFGLANGSRLLIASTQDVGAKKLLGDIATELARERAEQTSIKRFDGKSYLVSSASVGWGALKILSFVAEKQALGALDTLFHRSLIFIAFSVCVTILISLLLSTGLTKNLYRLAEAAAAIGQGHFDRAVQVKTNDEIGVLSEAFSKMGGEIGRLMVETEDKARMQAELKTASLVQESLFPRENEFQRNEISLSGFYMTSTECGGDWWYYFERGDDLFVIVADATGHGTPAALITSAARALFSKIERSNDSLLQMARDFDYAVSASSRQKVFMTAFLLRLDTKTGEGHYINACHEPPLLLTRSDAGVCEWEYLEVAKGATLGEGQSERFIEQSFVLKPTDQLILFTDGLFAVEDAEGKVISDRRFGKLMAGRCSSTQTASRLAADVRGLIEQQRGDRDLPDDVTAVILARGV